ncbi:MAG: PAS domain S-box protein [Balneolaceae bacterium]|nr:PAS domain S-box protein [Balneolaceae bacterium]
MTNKKRTERDEVKEKSNHQIYTQREHYRFVFENSIAALFITRPDGTILEANKAACRMFGYTEEEFKKQGMQGMIDPKSPDFSEKLKEREEKGSTSGEVIGIRKNGKRFWCEFSSSIFADADGNKMVSIELIDMFDTTDRQESLKGVMNNVPGVIYRYVTKPDGFEKIHFVTGEVKQVLGFNPDDIFKDKSLGWKNIHKDDVDRVIQSMNESAEKNTKWVCEYRYHHPDGTTRWLRGMGNPVSKKDGRVVWDSIVIDITKEKQAELNLKLMESVVTEANDAVLITKAEPVEAPEGPEIVYVNRSFEKMTGYTAEDVIGKTPRILQGANTGSKQLQELRNAIRNRESVEVELLNYNKSGDEYWVNISLSPMFERGKCTHFISIQKDITDRKLQELQKALSSEISLIFNREETVRSALQSSLDEIASLHYFDAVEFWLADRDRTLMNLAAHSIGNPEIEQFYTDGKKVEVFKKGEGLPGKTWKQKKNLFWRNLDKRKTFIRREKAAKAGVKTAFSFPVIDEEDVLGVLVLLASKDLKSERYYVDLFKELADQFASEIKRKEVEEELSRIFNSAPDVICIAGLDGYYKKVNPAMSELLGYTEKELLNTPIIEFVHPADKQKTEEEFEALNRGEGNHYFENRHITKSGKVIWLSWTTKPFYDEKITYSVAKDVTEEKELRQLLDRANRLAKIGSWEVDLINEEVYWSDITRQIHEEEPDFEPDLDAVLNYYKEGEARELIQQAAEETMKNGTPWDLELPIITAKGNEKWIRTIGKAEIVNGKPVRIYGSFQDIHKRKTAEEKLKEKTRQLDAIARFNALLIKEDDWFRALDKSLEQFGEVAGADRVYFFEHSILHETGQDAISMKAEWVSEGTTREIDNPNHQNHPFDDIQSFMDQVIHEGGFNKVVSEIEDKELAEFISGQQIKSILALPVFTNKQFRGFMGFDDCVNERIWSEEEVTFLKTIAINLGSAIENKISKERILKSESRLQGIIDSQTNYIIRTDLEGYYTYYNPKFKEEYGWIHDKDNLEGTHSMISIKEYHHDRVRQVVDQCMNNPNEVYQVEIDKPGKNGKIKTTLWDFVCLTDNAGKPTEIQCVGIDITEKKVSETELKESLREKEVLLAEIHHRVKNNLAVVSAMMQLQAYEEENELIEEKLNASISRIHTMATIHEILYQSGNFSKLSFSKILEKLIESISSTMGQDKNIDVRFTPVPLELNINQAIPCALIVNEVITNVYKHAFKGRKKGILDVNLSIVNDSVDIEIKDNGIGLPKSFTSQDAKSLGIHLIKTLALQLEAEYSFNSSGKGTEFRLRFTKADIRGSGNAQLSGSIAP